MNKPQLKKTIGTVKTGTKEKPSLIPEKYQTPVYLVLLAAAVLIFFGGAIFGNGFSASDTLASMSFDTYLKDAAKQGNFPQWVPYIFGGMPSYGALLSTGERLWDFIPIIVFGTTKFFGALLGSDTGRIASFYIIYAFGMYFLMRSKKHERFISFFTAFAAAFSTSVIIWIMIGHNTKPVVFAMFPYVFMFLEKLRAKFSLLYAALLVTTIHLMMEAGHLQMIFYGICAFGIYLLFELAARLISKDEPIKVIRAAGLLVVAGLLAFMMSSDRYLSTWEYQKYSTRGSAPIVNTKGHTQDAKGGNDYDYATMWSFSPSETMTFFVPNYFGFGKLNYKGPLSNQNEIKVMSYWGQKPFEDAAPYMGILVIGLALLGAVKYRKDAFVLSMIAISLFSLLLSFGYTFPILYDIFFNYIPFFNKFRAPSMALALMQFAVPILAGYGLSAIVSWRKEISAQDKKMFNIFLGASVFFLVSGLAFSALMQDSYISSVASSKMIRQYAESNAGVAEELKSFIWSSMTSDWLITGALAVAGALLMWLFVRNKTSKMVFYAGIAAILVFDLWRVGWRPMEIAESSNKSEFQETDLTNFLHQDKSKYRIAEFVFKSPNFPAFYRLESVNGYHSAKLRVYQDMLDVADNGSTSQVTNPFLWTLLNVKYIITPQPINNNPPMFQSRDMQAVVYQNPNFLPRAYFVNEIEKSNQKDILYHLKNGDFNPSQKAFVEKDISAKLDSVREGAYAKITDYRNEYIGLEVNATGNNLLCLSEIYYPVSWKAYLDGKETEIYKTNFAFRSVMIPNGKHKLEFKFVSEGFETGKTLSTATSILTILALAGGLFMDIKSRKKEKSEIANESEKV